jgi:tetratricopeptide (TPR) repeat protein
VGLDGVGQDKTTSILKCVEYSHSNLSEAAQQLLLLCLAPFSGFIYRDGIPGYAEELKKLEPFKDYDFAGFDDAIQEAINWGLLSLIYADNNKLLSIQPVFPYFLRISLNSDNLKHDSVMKGFKNHYQNLASYYNDLMESQNPQSKKLGALFCHYEYENLYAALQECLSRHESICIYFCLNLYFNIVNNIQSKLKMAELVNQSLSGYPTEHIEGTFWQEAVIASDYLANSYLETNQYEKAKALYEKNLQGLEDLQFIGFEQKNTYKAIIYHQLGIIAQESREWEKARKNYVESLKYSDLYSQAKTYHQLGTIADELREWDNARYNYLRSLEICEEFDDRYNQAKIYHQLAMVAQHSRKWEEAYNNYIQSLKICVEFGDEYSQASTYQQLGVLAQELRKWTEARSNYHKSFSIYMKFGDKYSQAKVYYQLGTVSQELREWEEALSNYSQALSMYSDFDEIYEQAAIYYQTGKILQKLGNLEEANKNYFKTMEIFTKFEDHYGKAKIYHQLGILAQETEQWEKAQKNYLQALEILVKFNDRYHQARVYHQLGIVDQELKQWDQAHHNYQQALKIKVEFDDRYLQASTYAQLGLLSEDRGHSEEAIKNMLMALEIFSEYEDNNGISLVMNNIVHICHSFQIPEIITTVAQILKVSEAEVQQIFDAMNQGT